MRKTILYYMETDSNEIPCQMFMLQSNDACHSAGCEYLVTCLVGNLVHGSFNAEQWDK